MKSPRQSCPHCKRPYLETDNEQRTREGNHPGLEKEAIKDIEEMNRSCTRIFEFLRSREPYDWVSGDDLRNVLNGGDGRGEFASLTRSSLFLLTGRCISRKMGAGKRITGLARDGLSRKPSSRDSSFNCPTDILQSLKQRRNYGSEK